MLGVFIAGLTNKGPQLLEYSPKDQFSIKEKYELPIKSLPITGTDGDFSAVTINSYQAVSILVNVPPFEESNDQRNTFVAFGVLLNKNTNPVTYQSMLQKITDTCRKNNILNVPILKDIVPKLQELTTTRILAITSDVSVEVEFGKEATSGERLRDALKRL